MTAACGALWGRTLCGDRRRLSGASHSTRGRSDEQHNGGRRHHRERTRRHPWRRDAWVGLAAETQTFAVVVAERCHRLAELGVGQQLAVLGNLTTAQPGASPLASAAAKKSPPPRGAPP